MSLRKKLLDTFGAQVSSDHERYPADVKCLGFLYLYVGRYPRNNASRNTEHSKFYYYPPNGSFYPGFENGGKFLLGHHLHAVVLEHLGKHAIAFSQSAGKGAVIDLPGTAGR
ncbi:MAG: hypothetical protein BECKG1743E_GA0114224_109961 [Candidatus Kentron sp. G]|nr:MAG: hypothetical protein BECKG1743E_GA0114224_109961 [Candidatus Kentron sp. G]